MDLAMQGHDDLKSRLPTMERSPFLLQPCTQVALVVNQGQQFALSIQKVLDGSNPSAMFNPGKKQGHIVTIDGREVAPGRIGAP